MARNKKEEKKKFEMPKAPDLGLSSETQRGIMVVFFSLLSAVTLLAILGIAGSLGKSYVNLLTWLLGILGYFVPALFLLMVILLAKHKLAGNEDQETDTAFYFRVYLGSLLLTGATAGLIHIFYLGEGISAF